jgi:hypothetical protein
MAYLNSDSVFWILLVLGILAAFSALVWVLNRIEDQLQRALHEPKPPIDDVTERRRLQVIAGGRS